MKKNQLKNKEILDILSKMFPNADCELNYTNIFELLVAVVLSAQTTDIRVNMVTKDLFSKYPDVESLASARVNEVKHIIQSVGLANTKSLNLVKLAQALRDDYSGVVPNSLDELITLPGVGRKTASVVLVEGFRVPAIPVDTHVNRVAKRLKMAKVDSSVLEVEKQLSESIAKEDWIRAHHLFIHFGRYFCKASNPSCDECPFVKTCLRTLGKYN